MSKFVVNKDMFGKYCTIPTGCSRAEHIYKIVARIESNTYCDVPLHSGLTEEATHKDVVPVLLVIHCGIDESEVERVALSDCKICGEPSGWISVNDRLPNINGEMLVYDRVLGFLVLSCSVAEWAELQSLHPRITHWRELPAPPRMEEKE